MQEETRMFEFIVQTFIGPLIIGAVLAVVGYVFNKKHEKRIKATLVAELLAEWYSDPNDRKKLNQLTWEASIWMPKKQIRKLNACLIHHKDAPTVMGIVADARKLILGGNETIDASEIVYFKPKA